MTTTNLPFARILPLAAPAWWVALDKRTALVSLMTVFAAFSFFLARYYYPWAPLGLASLTGAWILARKTVGPKPLFLALASIPFFWGLAALGANTWGFGKLDATITLALWWAVMLALYTLPNKESLLVWFIPAWLFQAGATIWKGLAGDLRPAVFADSPNVSGGFMVLGIAYLLTTRYKWLALPLMVALTFTGSRWATLVLVAVLIAMGLKRIVSWRFLVASALIVLVIVLPVSGTVTKSYRVYPLFAPPETVAKFIDRQMTRAIGDTERRLLWSPEETAQVDPEFRWYAPTWLLGIAPMGFMGANQQGSHSVPQRMIYELGLIPLAVWILASLWVLRRRPRYTGSWWMLVTFLGLCLLDYYAWMPFTISAFWWILLSIRGKPSGLPSPALLQYEVEGSHGSSRAQADDIGRGQRRVWRSGSDASYLDAEGPPGIPGTEEGAGARRPHHHRRGRSRRIAGQPSQVGPSANGGGR